MDTQISRDFQHREYVVVIVEVVVVVMVVVVVVVVVRSCTLKGVLYCVIFNCSTYRGCSVVVRMIFNCGTYCRRVKNNK